eukprot:TRINITY_DN5354_c0_g1_i3.p1 TRINITY_DN5354_c0_g1~~TRINITY_DN5354_c0_g1_i3.p1  ORF type:complete len:1684 (-),score=476.83 TRINITY_DN5354_c0_g1_i3:107-5158(-)
MASKLIKESLKESGGKTIVLDGTCIASTKSTAETIKKVVKKLPDLTSLSAINAKQSTFPSELVQLLRLESLDLDGSQLEQIPDDISRLTNLQVITLSKNNFKTFPLALWRVGLTRLTLASNQISSLRALDLTDSARRNNDSSTPLGFKLEYLDLSENFLWKATAKTTVATEGADNSQLQFAEFHVLKQLLVTRNALIQLPIGICQLITLTSLNLSENGLTNLPPEFGNLTNLVELLLRRNKLQSLPSEIGRLASLKTLSLSENELTELPDELGQLVTLQNLLLQINKLEALPSSISELTNLQRLNLECNRLATLPPSIGGLASLSELNLDNNDLVTLPPEIDALISLTKMMLASNQLSDLPPLTLPRLSQLTLQKNQFKTTDSLAQLGLLKNLRSLTLDQNPFEISVLDFIRSFGAMALVQQGTEKQERIRTGSMSADDLRKISRRSSSDVTALTKQRSWRSSLKSPFSKSPLSRQGSSSSVVSSKVSLPTSSAPSSPSKVPTYDEFKDDFENLMKELELPEDQVMKMPDDAKYKLLLQYRNHPSVSRSSSTSSATSDSAESSVTAPLSPTLSPVKSQQSPQHFCELLRSLRASIEDLSSLRVLLSSESRNWVVSFCEEQGIPLLLKFLDDLNVRYLKKRTKETAELVYECLRCVRLMTRLRLQDILSISEPSPAALVVAQSLDVSRFKVKSEALAILNKIIAIRSMGHQPVMNAFDFMATQKKLRERFQTLIDILHVQVRSSSSISSIDDLEERLVVIPLKTNCLSLVNHMIRVPTRLWQRIALRNEFLQSDMNKFIQEMKAINDDVAAAEAETFLDSMREDREELPSKVRTSDVFEIAPNATVRTRKFSFGNFASGFFGSRRDIDAGDLPDLSQLAINYLVIYNASSYAGATQAAISTRINFDQDIGVAQIYANVYKEFGIAPEDYDLYGILLNSYETPVWLDPQQKISFYNLSGEVSCEFRMRPWQLRVSFNGAENEMFFSPTSDCGVVLLQVQEFYKSALEENEEYALFFNGEDSGSRFWLKDTEKLASYQLIKKQGALELRLAPLELRVNFLESLSTAISFERNADVTAVMEVVSSQLNIAAEKSKDYGLALQGSEGPIWLKEGTQLSDYNIHKMDIIWCVLKPRIITVRLLDDSLKTLRFDYSRLASDLWEELSELKEIVTNCSLYFTDPQRGDVILHLDRSLRDQNVPTENTILFVKQQTDEEPPSEQADENLYEEKSNETTIVFEENSKLIFSATLNKLIEHITSDDEEAANSMLIVLLTYPHFTSTHSMLKKLLERYNVLPSSPQYKDKEGIQTRVCNLFEKWKRNPRTSKIAAVLNEIEITTENDKKTLATAQLEFAIKLLVQQEQRRVVRIAPQERNRELVASPSVRRSTDPANITRARRAPIPSELQQAIQSYHSEKLTPVIRKSTQSTRVLKLFNAVPRDVKDRLTFFNIYHKEVAQQLTKTAFIAYAKVQANEFLKQCWSKPKTQHLAPRIMELTALFNNLSGWASTAVLMEPKVADRAEQISNLIKIALHFRKLNNFHLLTAIISALNNCAVSRLKWTWKKVPKRSREILTDLENLMSMERSFNVYRTTLSQTRGPCIPYIGLCLQDLTFVDENPERIGDKQINFSKQRTVHSIIKDLLRFQYGTDYDIAVAEDIQRYLATMSIIDEKELYNVSLRYEPRNATRAMIE